ncbi:MAG: hypothetical protein EP308_07010 [Burkholderiales bacterium]|nr:MAG: hypothetical protein EP308_07010 [Burkholderiales bacterium]
MLPDLLRLSPTLLSVALLAACATTQPAPAPALTPPPPPPAIAASDNPEDAAATMAGQCVADATVRTLAGSPDEALTCVESIDSLDQALAYAERVRPMALAELQAELKALGDPGHQPARQMQVALVLMQMQQPVETARALGLLQRVQASATSEAETLRPLARLLAGMLSNQRRLEEQLERHAAQLRDAQRRIDRLGERLEAMRAIERSLGPRGNNGAPAVPRPLTP